MRIRNKKPLLKQNCSQRQGKGHQPCVLHKAVALTASKRGATSHASHQPHLGPPLALLYRAWYPAQSTGLSSALSTRGIPFPQLPFRTAGAPCRQMGVKVICQSKISNLIMVHFFSVRIYVPSMLPAWLCFLCNH